MHLTQRVFSISLYKGKTGEDIPATGRGGP
jgi:hypothetical protein